jgi:iron complex outermembrane receptor protein
MRYATSKLVCTEEESMSRRLIIGQAVRYALMAGTAIAAVNLCSTASAENANTPAHLGKVTVTGTRIKRTTIETAQPITRISRQQIERSGYTNITDLLAQQSFASIGTTSKSNNNTSSISLRGLGNNRRWETLRTSSRRMPTIL